RIRKIKPRFQGFAGDGGKDKLASGMLIRSRLRSWPVVVPALVLAVGLTTASWIYQALEDRRNEFNQAGLDRAVTALETQVMQRLRSYASALRGARGFLSVEG